MLSIVRERALISSSFSDCFRIQISTTLSNTPGRGITFFDLLGRREKGGVGGRLRAGREGETERKRGRKRKGRERDDGGGILAR